MKIAVYSCNTGNYRNELSVEKLNNIQFAKGIDYFFFTNLDIDIHSCKWNIYKIRLKDNLDFMNNNRNTAKFIKFSIPNVFKSYDYIIWCDTKSLKNIHSLNIEKIKRFISNTNKKIYLIKHPHRKYPEEELKKCLDLKIEKNATLFLKKLKNIPVCFNSLLPDTTTIIRKVDPYTNDIFMNIYEELLNNKLCRDQNIIQYVFYNKKCNQDIYYFSNQSEFRKITNSYI